MLLLSLNPHMHHHQTFSPPSPWCSQSNLMKLACINGSLVKASTRCYLFLSFLPALCIYFSLSLIWSSLALPFSIWFLHWLSNNFYAACHHPPLLSVYLQPRLPSTSACLPPSSLCPFSLFLLHLFLCPPSLLLPLCTCLSPVESFCTTVPYKDFQLFPPPQSLQCSSSRNAVEESPCQTCSKQLLDCSNRKKTTKNRERLSGFRYVSNSFTVRKKKRRQIKLSLQERVAS